MMHNKISFFILLTCCLLCSSLALAQPEQNISSENALLKSENDDQAGSVDIQQLERIFTASKDRKYAVQYAYEFPGRDLIEITGLGTVPSKGTFKYLSQRNDLEFRDPRNGEVLRRVLLKTASAVAINSLMDIPRHTEFPNAYRAFSWEPSKSLQEMAQATLGRHNFKYAPMQVDEVFYIVTTYAPLQLSEKQEHQTAQIALMFSFPYSKKNKSFEFRVSELVKEGRTRSKEYRETSDPEIMQTAAKFVDAIVSEMRAGKIQ